MLPFRNPYKKQRAASASPRSSSGPRLPFEVTYPFITVHVENDPACFCDACQRRMEQEDPSSVLVSPPRENRLVCAGGIPVPDPVVAEAGAPAASGAVAEAAVEEDPPQPPRRVNFVRDRTLPLALCVRPSHYGPNADGSEARSLVSVLSRIQNVTLEPANAHARRVVNVWDAPHNQQLSNAHANGALHELAGIGMDVASVRTTINDLFSGVVASCFLTALSNIGIHRLSHAGNIAPRDETRPNSRSFATNYKANILFIPLMATDKKISTLNCRNGTEFYYNDNGQRVSNPSFWEDHVSIKRAAGGNFSSIEIGAFVPEWSIPEADLQEHKLAMTWMAENGPVFPNGQVFYLSLKQEYVTVFIRNMQSPLVAAARNAGFFPVFAAKNLLVQKTDNFGLNGVQLTTINMQPRSYLALVGFSKGDKDDLQIITIKNDNNELMVLPNNNA